MKTTGREGMSRFGIRFRAIMEAKSLVECLPKLMKIQMRLRFESFKGRIF